MPINRKMKSLTGSPGLPALIRVTGVPALTTARAANDVSRVCAEPLPLNQWITVTIVGDRGRTTAYVNGVKAGEHGEPTLCQLAQLGSRTGNSFVGKVRGLKVYNRVMTTGEIEHRKV